MVQYRAKPVRESAATMMVSEETEVFTEWRKRTDDTLRKEVQELKKEVMRETRDTKKQHEKSSARHRQDVRGGEDASKIVGIVLKAVLTTLVFFVGLVAIIEKLVRK